MAKFEAETVLIPHIPMITMDKLIEFKILPFLVKLAVAMIINKSQEANLLI